MPIAGEALILGGFKSKNEAANQALREFVQRRKQCEVVNLFGCLPAAPTTITKNYGNEQDTDKSHALQHD